jgi:glutathione S-transferase
MGMLLYDLAGADEDRRFSPYCWRVKLALAHKRLQADTVPWRFTEKAAIAASGNQTVPVLVDGGRWITDSWAIANHLEDAYPERLSLFGGGAGRELSRLHSVWGDVLVGSVFSFIGADVLAIVHEKDREYFRSSREKRLGKRLEDLVADRERRVDAFRESLAPLRVVLRRQRFFGGEAPLYADFAIFGTFQWARCTSPFVLLAKDDPIRRWRDQLLDIFGGLARNVPAFAS